jgi:hypothetical protein
MRPQRQPSGEDHHHTHITKANMALRMLTNKIMGFASRHYKQAVGSQLQQYGMCKKWEIIGI